MRGSLPIPGTESRQGGDRTGRSRRPGGAGKATAWIGNDIVDFAAPLVLASYLRPRFVERICTYEERANLATSREPGPYVCALLAAKEATYKVVSKLDSTVIFAHRRFAVSARFDTVSYDGLCVSLRLARGDDWSHAVAWLGSDTPLVGIGYKTDSADPSVAARNLLYAELARRTNRPARDFTVVREARSGSWDGFAPPRLVARGLAEPLDVSLSHDGRLVAFAAPANVVERSALGHCV